MLTTQIDAIEARLHEAVEHADDQGLFINSYLHGHFDVVVSHTLRHDDADLALLDQCMQESLQSAFANNELEAQDQSQVFALWQSLIKSVS
ncbi:YfcL family protein [Alteromonas facilis]|uniref:YfcL family protein n=1 Tax=Alteromonas facilis TaxID=2048004 RepID=UPI000C28909F|nr:YfcL family protein [Alteromonas facilis]